MTEKQKKAEYRRERRKQFLLSCRCVSCGEQDERTLSGKTLCAACSERNREYDAKRYECGAEESSGKSKYLDCIFAVKGGESRDALKERLCVTQGRCPFYKSNQEYYRNARKKRPLGLAAR